MALVAWLTGQPCPRTIEYRFVSADGAGGKLASVGVTVYRKITFIE